MLSDNETRKRESLVNKLSHHFQPRSRSWQGCRDTIRIGVDDLSVGRRVTLSIFLSSSLKPQNCLEPLRVVYL